MNNEPKEVKGDIKFEPIYSEEIENDFDNAEDSDGGDNPILQELFGFKARS